MCLVKCVYATYINDRLWDACPSMPDTPGAIFSNADKPRTDAWTRAYMHAWKRTHRWGLGNVTRSQKPTCRKAWCGELGDLERPVQHPERWRHLVPVQGKISAQNPRLVLALPPVQSELSRPRLETLAVMRDVTALAGWDSVEKEGRGRG